MQCRGKWSFPRISRHSKRVVTRDEIAAQRVPSVEQHRQATIHLAQAALDAHQHQG